MAPNENICPLCGKHIAKYYMKSHIEMVHGQLTVRETEQGGAPQINVKPTETKMTPNDTLKKMDRTRTSKNKDSETKISDDKVSKETGASVSKRKRKRPAWMVEDELVKDIDDEQYVPKSKVSKTKVFERTVSVNKKTEKVDPLEDTLKEIFEPNEKTVKLLNSKAKKAT